MAYALRVASAMLGTAAIEPLAAPGSAPSLSKRGVVVSVDQWLRSVESEYGESPKKVLFETFAKLRRTASTTSSKRMSSRFAHTPLDRNPLREDGGQDLGGADGNWRAIGDVARDVLRSAAVSVAVAKMQ